MQDLFSLGIHARGRREEVERVEPGAERPKRERRAVREAGPYKGNGGQIVMDVKMLPYAGWLEETIRLLSRQDVQSIALAAKVNDGEVLTAYFKADVSDKAVMATFINGDALFEMVKNNARLIVEAAEEQEDPDEEDP